MSGTAADLPVISDIKAVICCKSSTWPGSAVGPTEVLKKHKLNKMEDGCRSEEDRTAPY